MQNHGYEGDSLYEICGTEERAIKEAESLIEGDLCKKSKDTCWLHEWEYDKNESVYIYEHLVK